MTILYKPATVFAGTCSRWLAAAAFAAGALGAHGDARAADVGVSISIAQPGVYGRVDIGRYPQPVLVMPQPVIVQRTVVREPVYLWVPPGHRKHWKAHCAAYGACGVPVYFVQDTWYHQHVAVAAPPGHGHPQGHHHDADHEHPGKGHGRGHGRGHDKH
jgi:hypothetical protein